MHVPFPMLLHLWKMNLWCKL